MKTETAEHRRKRLAFQKWLRKELACKKARRFVRERTAREAWSACKTKEHQEWMDWFLRHAEISRPALLGFECADSCCVHGGPAAVRKLVKPPRVFEWEKKAAAK